MLENLLENLRDTLCGNKLEETGTVNQEGTELDTTVREGNEGTNAASGGFYVQNGILYNGSIDSMLSNLYQDMSENLAEQAEKKAELEASGEPYMDGAGIIHNASWESDYQSLMSELPGQIEKMAEINRENAEKGIFPPLYDGFASNPYYDPTGSWSRTMDAWDTVNSMNTVSAPDYTAPKYTAEELESEIKHSTNLAGQYAADGMTNTASSYLNRAERAAEKLEDLD